jgi:hypothetical protein
MELVFRLRGSQNLDAMRRASLDRSTTIGLRNTHGVIGTNEWWEAIESGALPVQTLRGVVRGLWLGQYNVGGPAEFCAEAEDGSLFGGLCECEPDQAKSLFTLGRIVEVDVVEQLLKEGNVLGSTSARITLEIRLGKPSPGATEPIPSYFGS